MREDTALLVELMLQAEVFCSAVDAAATKQLVNDDLDELRLKVSQCRGALSSLQRRFEDDQLTITDSVVRGDFRQLVISLMWVCFRGGSAVDRKLFRRLVQIESGFTYLLITARGRATEEPID